MLATGEVDGCAVQPISQGQFTPLPEALCWVVWELNLAERSTTLDDVTAALGKYIPHSQVTRPTIFIFKLSGRNIITNCCGGLVLSCSCSCRNCFWHNYFTYAIVVYLQVIPSRIWYRPATKSSTTRWANSSATER